MTDDTPPPNDVENRSNAHQQAIEACEHAADALHGDDLSHARTLLDEARTAVERAQHDESSMQAQREAAWDCYG